MEIKAQNEIQKQITNKGISDKIIFALLSILIIGAPLFQGLFFQREIMISNIFTFAIFMLFLFNKKRKEEKLTIFNSPYDYIGLLFIVAYLLPIIFFQWANLRDAIDILIRYTTYYAIYLMIKDMGQSGKYKDYFTKVLIFGSLIVAFIGIFGAAGYIGLDDVIMGNRISSTFQYPNTLAALMMSMFFLVNGSIHKSEKYLEKLIYGVSGFIMLFTFIFTYSRAAWLLFPIFALLYLIFISGKDRIASILYFIAALVPNILVLQPFTSQLGIDAQTKPKALLVFFIGAGIFKVLYSIMLFVQSKLEDKYYKFIYGFLGAIVIGTTIFGYMALNTTVPLIFDNLNATESYTNQIQRTIKAVEGNKDYTFQINTESISETEDEAQWPWRVRINSVNETGQQELLVETIGEPSVDREIDIPFTTLEDTQNISIHFTNIYPDTKVTFKAAKLINEEGIVLEDIKLKYKYLPESLISRFNSIDLNENSSTERLTFYKDSFSILKSKPIFGGGGGTWKALYLKYQSLPYNSTEAHNYFLQTMVETGIIGITIFILLILAFVVHLLRAWKKKDTLTISILFSILALLVHSGLDFNFSFHSIPIIFWTLISLLEYKTFADMKLKIKKIDFRDKNIGLGIPTAFAIPLLLFSISLYSAYAISIENSNTINQIPLDESIGKMNKAVLLDPFHPNIRIDLAKMLRYYGLETGQFDLVEKAENHYKKAVKYSSYNSIVLQEITNHYINIANFEKGFEHLDRSMKVAPLNTNNYEFKSDIYNVVADYYLSTREVEKAIDIYKNNILGIIDEVRLANDKTTEPIQLSPNTLQNIFRSKYFVDNYNDPEKLQQLKDIAYISYLDLEGSIGIKTSWNKWNAESGKIELQTSQEGLKVHNTGLGTGMIISPYFSLKPESSYELVIIFSSESTLDTLDMRIISSVGGTIPSVHSIELDQPIENSHSFNFTTTEDLILGKQNIYIYHPGKTDDYFTIKQVIVREIN